MPWIVTMALAYSRVMETTQAAERAMTGWLGALGKAGLIEGENETATVLAQFVVGEEGIASLRDYPHVGESRGARSRAPRGDRGLHPG